MTYRVLWTRKASNQLAAIWMAASDRNAVTVASHLINQALVRDPENQGESRPRRRRIMFEAPLAVVFRIDHESETVIVNNCRAY